MSKGFSLIEMIIALALVLATILVFAAALQSSPLTRHARNQNVAYHVAADQIEELRNTQFSSLPASGSFSGAGLNNLTGAQGEFTITDYQGSSDIKQVVVTVTWLEGGSAKSLSLETLMSENGLSKP